MYIPSAFNVLSVYIGIHGTGEQAEVVIQFSAATFSVRRGSESQTVLVSLSLMSVNSKGNDVRVGKYGIRQ